MKSKKARANRTYASYTKKGQRQGKVINGMILTQERIYKKRGVL